MALDSGVGLAQLNEGSYIRLCSKGDSFGHELIEGTSAMCSAYMANTDHPLLKFSVRAYQVALTNHAAFEGTLAYVEVTGAKRVVTDNTRSHGVNLAIAINSRLPGIGAESSTNGPVQS